MAVLNITMHLREVGSSIEPQLGSVTGTWEAGGGGGSRVEVWEEEDEGPAPPLPAPGGPSGGSAGTQGGRWGLTDTLCHRW